MAEMNRNGFEIIPAEDVISYKINLVDYEKYVITLEGQSCLEVVGWWSEYANPL